MLKGQSVSAVTIPMHFQNKGVCVCARTHIYTHIYREVRVCIYTHIWGGWEERRDTGPEDKQ